MARRDLFDLLLLAALWGASFLFMRWGAPEFGPLALVFLRVGGAAALLLPLALARGEGAALKAHWATIGTVGVANSALPFVLFTVAALVLSAALMSVFNATTPIWTALIAWAWLGERPGLSRGVGLAVGVAGVVMLSWGKADFRTGEHGLSPALGIAACVLAAALYGVAAVLARRRLQGLPPMALAAGSQLSAALVLALPAAWAWPATMPGARAWLSAVALAVLCTGVAYWLYFRLLERAGATNAVSVTLLIPPFAALWGWLFLGETLTPAMLAGGVVILLGTALSTGLLKLPARSAKA